MIVRGDGVGGRNQELVLSFALELHLSQPEIVRAGYQVINRRAKTIYCGWDNVADAALLWRL